MKRAKMNRQIIYNAATNFPEFVVIPWTVFTSMEDKLYDFEYGDIPKTIENPIKAMRTFAELTQSELADLMGVSQSYIGQVESPRKKPTVSLIDRVKRAIESQ